jgi:hypothetical protein
VSALANHDLNTYFNTCRSRAMQKRLTITVYAEVYDGLHAVVGRRRISRFLSDLARPHVVGKDLGAGYASMAADEARERVAGAWTEGLVADVADEPRRRG